MKQHFFVNVMMALQLCAIGSYSYQKNYGLALYWFACLLINYVVTYILVK